MLGEQVLSIPQSIDSRQTYVLSRRIAAVRLLDLGNRRGKLGDIMQLPPGTRLAHCGDGYNERTIKVQCNGEFYFVFMQDLHAA